MAWDETTAHLVEEIYDTIDEDYGWMPVLGKMSEDFYTNGAHIFVQQTETGEFLENRLYGADESFALDYARLAHTDPAIPLCAANPNKVINDIDFFGDAFFESTPLYNEVMKVAGARYRATCTLPLDENTVAGFALLRAKPLGSFDREQIERLKLLMPHVKRATYLQRRIRALESEADNLVAALDRLPTAAILVSESLQIVCLNRQADAMLASSNHLRARRGVLVPEVTRESTALKKAAQDAIALANGDIDAPLAPPPVVSISRGAQLPLEVLAVPLRPRYRLRGAGEGKARVMLLIYDPNSRPLLDPQLIERLFDLTSTEAIIAARLAEGHSIADIARERCCSASTVRTHVKHIFQKTHTNRQGELVQLILTSPAISFAE